LANQACLDDSLDFKSKIKENLLEISRGSLIATCTGEFTCIFADKVTEVPSAAAVWQRLFAIFLILRFLLRFRWENVDFCKAALMSQVAFLTALEEIFSLNSAFRFLIL